MPQPLAVTAFMASPGRFELPAPRLGGVCSIQLSYGDMFDFLWSRMEQLASKDFDDLTIRRYVCRIACDVLTYTAVHFDHAAAIIHISYCAIQSTLRAFYNQSNR